MKALILAAALSACAATYRGTRPPTWRYAVDFAGMAVGAAVGMEAHFSRPQDRTMMLLGYGTALVFWGPYWFVRAR